MVRLLTESRHNLHPLLHLLLLLAQFEQEDILILLFYFMNDLSLGRRLESIDILHDGEYIEDEIFRISLKHGRGRL